MREISRDLLLNHLRENANKEFTFYELAKDFYYHHHTIRRSLKELMLGNLVTYRKSNDGKTKLWKLNNVGEKVS